MTLENYYIQAQLNILGIQLALAGDAPKRSGDFETKYKTATGVEVAVKRSPDGKFANKNGGATSQGQSASTIGIEKSFGKAVSGFADDIAKMPAKVQEAVRKTMFDSELSRAIDSQTEKFVKKINDPNFTAGFDLGQRIKDELAKKPFSKFGETVAAKFEEFKKDLPQKSENLRKEIVRIAKDPNTATTVATGALIGLAAYFHITGVFKIIQAARISYGLLKIPKSAAIEIEKEFVKTATATFPGLAEQDAIASVKGMGEKAVNALKIAGAIDVGLHFLGAGFHNIVAAVLTSHAGRIMMNNAMSNETSEKEQLKTKILAEPEDSDALYQEMADQSAKDQETKQKILAGLQQETSQEELINTMMTLALPTLSIDVGKKDEDYLTNNPQESSRIFQKVYEDASVKSLFAELDTAMAMELQAMFADKPVPQSESQVETIKKEVETTIAKLVKAEVEQTNLKENSLTNNVAQAALVTTLLGAAGKDLKAKLISSSLDPGIQKGIQNTNISSIVASGSSNLEDVRQYADFKIRQARNELELLKLKDNVKSEASKLAVGAATLACSTAGFIFGVATYATVSAIKNHPEYIADFMDGFAKGMSGSGKVHTQVNQLTKELVDSRTNTEFTKALNDEIAKNTNDVVRTLERKIYAVGKALQE